MIPDPIEPSTPGPDIPTHPEELPGHPGNSGQEELPVPPENPALTPNDPGQREYPGRPKDPNEQEFPIRRANGPGLELFPEHDV